MIVCGENSLSKTIVKRAETKNTIIIKTLYDPLTAAIISDTLLFRSPTSTIVDEAAAKELAAISEVDIQELAEKMF